MTKSPPAPSIAPRPFVPETAQEMVGFTIFCLRNLALGPTHEGRTQLKNLFVTARSIVKPAASFPGWILNVGLAAFATLVAEGEVAGASQALIELESLDREFGGGSLDKPEARAVFEGLKAQAASLTTVAEESVK